MMVQNQTHAHDFGGRLVASSPTGIGGQLVPSSTGGYNVASTGGSSAWGSTGSTSVVSIDHNHAIFVDGNHAHTTTIGGSTAVDGTGASHENRQPFQVCAYIIKL